MCSAYCLIIKEGVFNDQNYSCICQTNIRKTGYINWNSMKTPTDYRPNIRLQNEFYIDVLWFLVWKFLQVNAVSAAIILPIYF